ncbi:MAG: c-type cytochrome [Nitrospirota bacterium]
MLNREQYDMCNLFLAACLILAVAWPASSFAQDAVDSKPAAASEQEIEAGKALYQKWCVNCHGEEGDGEGPAAEFVRPRPRNFRTGLFKIRSTVGVLPSDQDLFDIITRGMPGTSMPAWDKTLKEQERRQLVHYVKTFSRRFARATEPPQPLTIGSRVSSSAESIEQGKELFRSIECFKCHGEEGRGDGPSAPELTDDWGFPIRPANLTKPWNFRGGHAPEELYRRLHAGVAGTPMPSFTDSLDNEKTWHLINYVMSLWPDPSGNHPPLKVVLKAHRVEDEIPDAPGDEFWNDYESFDYSLVGQVIEDPRQFTPSVDMIQVQAIYNENELALRLVWDDPTHSRPDPAAGVFEDAVAVQFPVEIPSGAKRPFFVMGDEQLGVQLLRWSTAGGEAGAALEQNGHGVHAVTTQPADTQQTTAAGEFSHGQYRVVLKRPLTTGDAGDIQLEAGRFIPVAFFVWDGSNGETGSKMAISHWYYFLMEPPTPTTVYIYPAVGVIVAAGLQWWVIRRLRRKS